MSASVIWVLIEFLSFGALLILAFVGAIILFDAAKHKAPEYIDEETSHWLNNSQG